MYSTGKDDILGGVGCSVENCEYHSEDDRCHAENITVSAQQDSCSNEKETFCDTFVSAEHFAATWQ